MVTIMPHASHEGRKGKRIKMECLGGHLFREGKEKEKLS